MEPHTAARIYSEMVGEHPSISTLFQQVAVDVIMEGHRVVGVVTRIETIKETLASSIPTVPK